MPELSHPLKVERNVLPRVLAEFRHCAGWPQRALLKQLERRPDHGIERPVARECHQQARFDRLTGDGGPDPACEGQVQKYRTGQHAIAAMTFQSWIP